MTKILRPNSPTDAARCLIKNEGAIAMAGCTDLMVIDYAEQRTHPAVVDLLAVPELAGITDEPGGGLRIGATTTFQTIGSNPIVQSRYPILAEAAACIGGWQIQNRATLGGNIANASPAGDSLPVLLALDAEVTLVGPSAERRIDYRQMHLGYRRTALQTGEFVGWVHLPPPSSFQQFRKVGTRAAQAISKVVVAMTAEPDGNVMTNVRVAAGSIAATPIHLEGVEALLEGQGFEAELADRAEVLARSETHPIDDVRSTAAYRSHVLGRVIRRMILAGRSGVLTKK